MRTNQPSHFSIRCVLAVCLVPLVGVWGAVGQDAAPAFERPAFEDLTAWDVLRINEDGTIQMRAGDRERKTTLAGIQQPEPENARDTMRRFLMNLLEGERVYVFAQHPRDSNWRID